MRSMPPGTSVLTLPSASAMRSSAPETVTTSAASPAGVKRLSLPLAASLRGAPPAASRSVTLPSFAVNKSPTPLRLAKPKPTLVATSTALPPSSG